MGIKKRHDPNRTEPTRTEPTRTEPNRTDPTRPAELFFVATMTNQRFLGKKHRLNRSPKSVSKIGLQNRSPEKHKRSNIPRFSGGGLVRIIIVFCVFVFSHNMVCRIPILICRIPSATLCVCRIPRLFGHIFSASLCVTYLKEF